MRSLSPAAVPESSPASHRAIRRPASGRSPLEPRSRRGRESCATIRIRTEWPPSAAAPALDLAALAIGALRRRSRPAPAPSRDDHPRQEHAGRRVRRHRRRLSRDRAARRRRRRRRQLARGRPEGGRHRGARHRRVPARRGSPPTRSRARSSPSTSTTCSARSVRAPTSTAPRSDPIYVAVYAGDGTAGLDDFGRGDRVATVATGGAGITDATLGSSGPVSFDVDLTAALKELLGGGATHLGLVFSTDDTPTGTSLDDLGVDASGPPGVGGATAALHRHRDDAPDRRRRRRRAAAGPSDADAATPTPQPTNPIEAALIQRAPDGTGDQLVFYFDARDSFTTFLNLHNPATTELTVSLAALRAGPPASRSRSVVALAPGATRTIDVGALRDDGLAGAGRRRLRDRGRRRRRAVVSRASHRQLHGREPATPPRGAPPRRPGARSRSSEPGVSSPPIGAPIDGTSVAAARDPSRPLEPRGLLRPRHARSRRRAGRQPAHLPVVQRRARRRVRREAASTRCAALELRGATTASRSVAARWTCPVSRSST